MSKSVARLYNQFQPENYNLTINLDEAAMRFSGHVTLTGRKVGRPSKRLTFHANGLKITSGKISFHGKKSIEARPITRINLQKSLHEVRLHTESLLYPGEYTVEMEFEAPITRGMTGIYPCFYKNIDIREDSSTAPQDDSANGSSILFATQFESHHAREAFPCIDEPEAKATFDLTIITKDGVEVLSNTPIKSQKIYESRDMSQETEAAAAGREQTPVRSAGVRQSRTEENGMVANEAMPAPNERLAHLKNEGYKTRFETTFETTPRMSTYLLAFVTGNMIHKTAQTKSGVTVNIWATVAQPASSLDFGLEVAVKSIEFFEDYFGVPYPLPKADHVALPDFSSGAMENWGLITYRERVLLAYEGDTGQSTREQIALVVAHETSHQWFGNLVTMRWWNDLWLNESFANMMEYQCVDAIFPEWQVWNTFIGSEGLSAFRRDSIAGVQAVRTDVNHPDEISTLFDPSIVYAKGGRLLYMLKNYIGEDAFRRGLSMYFETHKYANTTGDDLWAALSTASGKDISAFMTPWLTRSGFPVLTIDQSKAQDTTHVTISQQHFLDDPSKSDQSRLWPVPLFSDSLTVDTLTSQSTEISLLDLHKTSPDSGRTSAELMGIFSGGSEAVASATTEKCSASGDSRPEAAGILRKSSLNSNKPVLLNQASAGHYLVRYLSDETNNYIRKMIQNQSMSEPDRLMVLNAASMFAKAGYASFADAIKLLSAYENEASEPVWDMMALITGEARRFIDLDESLEIPLKALCERLSSKQAQRLGWDEKPGESASDQKLRGLVLGLGLYSDDEDLVREATAKFAAARTGQLKLPAELRGLIMATPIKNGDEVAFDYLLDLHDSTTNSDMKNDVADALTATRSPGRAAELLARLKDAKLVKPQDADRWLVYLLRNRFTRQVAWDWMVDNWAWLEETYKNDKSYDYLPRYAASCVNTSEYAKKFHALFDSKANQPLLKRNIELGTEEITTRLAWLERDLKPIQKLFKSAQ